MPVSSLTTIINLPIYFFYKNTPLLTIFLSYIKVIFNMKSLRSRFIPSVKTDLVEKTVVLYQHYRFFMYLDLMNDTMNPLTKEGSLL